MRRSITGLNFFERFLNPKSKKPTRPRPGFLELFGDTVARAPKIIFAFIMVLTLVFWAASSGLLPGQEKSMQDNISSDLDQYIPEGTEEKNILDVVRENWATKVVIILVKTGNAYDPANCQVNITNRDVLEEMSSVEGDDFHSGVNHARGDSGKLDWVEYTLSLPALIKEINSSTPRMMNVLQEEMANELAELFGQEVDVSGDDEYLADSSSYAIPQEQDQVDQIIAQIPDDVLNTFCADTNADGIWDTSYILMGCLEETPDEEERVFIDGIVEGRRIAQSSDSTKPYFQDENNPHHTEVTQTGLIAIMIDITEEANDQLMKAMPLAILFVVGIMLAAHRSWKVFAIAGIPLICTIFWTFGIITLTGLKLSPIIVAAMPMLVGLSVDYSLHISNRITEFEEEGLTIREGITQTLHTTGVAVLLSAVTTMIGFAALLIAPLSPIRMLGLVLIVGIASAFLLSLTIVPCLVIMFKYRKPELNIWEKVAEVPVKHRWPIIGVVLVVTMLSLANISTMTETEEGDQEMDTQGIDSLDAIMEFSELWSQGSTCLLVIEPKQGSYPEGGALNDSSFLDQIDLMEQQLTSIEDHVNVEDVSAMTIVDLFKSVSLNLSWTTVENQNPLPFPNPIPLPGPIGETMGSHYYTTSYWDFIHLSDDPDFQERAIKIFYNSLTQEARDMLMTPDFSMTLAMVRFPFVGTGVGEQIVDSVNTIADDANSREGSSVKISHATSGAAISLTIDEAIMNTQLKTLVLSLVLVFVALTLVFLRSDVSWAGAKKALRYALLTMIPVATVVAWQPLIMKGVSSFDGGASLNMMTAMISSVVIGAGIDFGVHITERIREEGETIEGIKRAVQHTGQSIMEANLTTVAGLSGGLFVVWFRGFFSVLLLLLLYSMFAGMILLPAVYAALAGFGKKEEEDPEGLADNIPDAQPVA